MTFNPMTFNPRTTIGKSKAKEASTKRKRAMDLDDFQWKFGKTGNHLKHVGVWT